MTTVLARRESAICSAVSALRQHPLVDRITDHTYAITGGWARAFLFVPQLDQPRCIVIDPGVSNSLEQRFNRMQMERFRHAAHEIVRGDIETLMAEMQHRHTRIALLNRLVAAMKTNHKVSDGVDEFLDRSRQIAGLIAQTDLKVDAIYATHHHIDHLGVGLDLRNRLGIDERVFLPNPNILVTDRRKSDYPLASSVDDCQTIRWHGDNFGMVIINISGHTHMIGFLLPDGTLIVGDLVGTRNMWNACVMYMEDAQQHLTSLLRILGTPFERVVLSHGTEYVLEKRDADVLIKLNIARVLAARRAISENKGVVEAAEAYLKPADGEIDNAYLIRVMTTAFNIEGYR